MKQNILKTNYSINDMINLLRIKKLRCKYGEKCKTCSILDANIKLMDKIIFLEEEIKSIKKKL